MLKKIIYKVMHWLGIIIGIVLMIGGICGQTFTVSPGLVAITGLVILAGELGKDEDEVE